MKRRALFCAATLALACVPGAGPFRLGTVEGRVLDVDSGEPVADALVVEWHRGAGRSDASQPVYHARWDTSDAEGRFRLEPAVAGVRMWVLRTYDPVYAFYHPRYGLQRGAREEGGERILRGSLARAEQAHLDLRPFCRGEQDDSGARRIAEVACPKRTPSR